jgi:hypothetical protein
MLKDEERAKKWLQGRRMPLNMEENAAWYRDLAALLAQMRLEATLAEHKSHIEFESELYAILVDPLADGVIKEEEMRKQLREAALRSREFANRFNFTDLLKAAWEGLAIWAAKPGNQKWWKRIDGTPIPNDLLVNIVERIAALEALAGGEKEK